MIANITTGYPTLRANEPFQQVMNQLAAQEATAQQALDRYNRVAADHNNVAGRLPGSLFWTSPPVDLIDLTMKESLLPVSWDADRKQFAMR